MSSSANARMATAPGLLQTGTRGRSLELGGALGALGVAGQAPKHAGHAAERRGSRDGHRARGLHEGLRLGNEPRHLGDRNAEVRGGPDGVERRACAQCVGDHQLLQHAREYAGALTIVRSVR